jgi:hypothetical protein
MTNGERNLKLQIPMPASIAAVDHWYLGIGASFIIRASSFVINGRRGMQLIAIVVSAHSETPWQS